MNKKVLFLLSSLLSTIIINIKLFNILYIKETSLNNKNLNITVNTAIQKLAAYEVEDIKRTNSNTQLAILKKLFNGITVENLNNFKVSISDKNVVTLMGVNGYTFLGSKTIETNFITESVSIHNEMNLISKTSPSLFGIELLNAIRINHAKQLKVLKELFIGITNIDQPRIISMIGKDNVITLIAKEGFKFKNKTYLNSNNTVQALF
ncbi:MAG: hypothetical protein ACRCRP_00485 [Metamycoplasmataceae bacterium]